ncbi:MAG: hypothetical protein DHS20C17_31360 [Cyclobacteriaceae bacterium]|nr:MAG: hypothetical protein DHS20C17_31360 [Cyclobacteriaceae bacterium]
MHDISIREMTPSDMPLIEELVGYRPELNPESAKKRTRLMQWIAFNNPCANGVPTYFVALKNNKIIGYHGRMPCKFNVKGKVVNGYYIHDLYVDPEIREKGLGFFLTRALAKEIENKSDDFFVLIWMTKLNLLIQRRMGYTELDKKIATYKKVLKSKKYLETFLKPRLLASIAAPLVDGVLWLMEKLGSPGSSRGPKLTPIDRFDERFDDLFQRVSKSMGISSIKSSNVLNWRYIDRPYPRDKVYALEQDNQIKGFVVLCENPRDPCQGEIMELVADPDDHLTIKSLLHQSVNLFKDKGYHSIGCFMSNEHFSRYLRKFGFLKRTNEKVMLIGNCNPADLDILTDLQNWHIMRAESDGYMLNF